MRLGAKSCAHYFGNQSLEWRYEGVVQKITTNAFGVTVAEVLYEEDDEATESALHHVYPLDEDDLPYDGDVKRAEDVYRAEIAASKAKKGKKKAKPPASSGTAKKGTGEPAKKKAKTKSASKTWALPDLEWTKVNEFDDERNMHRPKSFLNTTRTADTSAWDEGQYLLHCLPGNWKEIAKKMNEDKRMTGRAKVTQEEVQLFVALVFAMSVQPLANRSDYWKKVQTASDLFPPCNFDRLGMSEDRFNRLWSCFVLPTHSDSASDDEEEEDEWDCIRKYIDDWNTNSAERCCTVVGCSVSTSS